MASTPAGLPDTPNVESGANRWLSNMFGGTLGMKDGLNDMIAHILNAWTKLGTGASTPTTAGDVLYVTGSGTSAWGPRALVRIAPTQVLGAAAANVAFASIPATYQSLILVIQARGDTAATSATILLRLNSDAGSNYASQSASGSGSTASAAEVTSGNTIQCGSMPANTAPANAGGICIIEIPHYAHATYHQMVDFRASYRTATGAGGLTTVRGTGIWTGTPAAISHVRVIAGAGNFAAGTVMSLYGVPAS